ncbi:MAG: hypothetical protein FWG10_06240 [Eubacteriaceae bacterium]|nr:hypothetical protein [Eubacteriaceae bacterium]
MSLPIFPSDAQNYEPIGINNSIAQIFSSIAMEELALSHILNAEGEKLQYVLSTAGLDPDVNDLLDVNTSVRDMISTVSMSQMFLLGKLTSAMSSL